MNDCDVYTCGLCICNPAMCNVGVGAATANPGTPVCGSVGTACCGMAQVAISGSRPTVWPWVVGIGAALYLLSRRHRA